MSDRINLNASPKTREMVEAMQTQLDLGSISEVVRRALAVLSLLLRYRAEGAEIIVRHPKDGEIRIEIV